MTTLTNDQRRAALAALCSSDPIADSARQQGATEAEAREWIATYLAEKASLGRPEVKTGVNGGAEIVRDRRGVPHISAEDPADLFFALGYAQAQDRLWQLDYLRRQAHGRLSEIYGEATLAGDILSRTLDMSGIAEAAYAQLGPDSRVATDAFTAGVNAWMNELPAGLPVEFELLGYEPEPWRAVDSLAIQRRWWWYLTGRLPVITLPEIVRAALRDDAKVGAYFLPDAPVTYIVPAGNYDPAPAWPGLATDPVSPGFGSFSAPAGSNNWAAGPAATTGDHALLASDPHVYFSVPADWYEVHLHGAGHDAFGACYPAMPGILIGRNHQLSWGVTNNICSLRDLFVEEINPENPAEYRRDGGWTAFAERVDEIAVKGGETVRHTTRYAHGRPVVDHLMPGAALPRTLWGESFAHSALSLAWVGFEPSDETQCLLDVQRATTVDGAREAYRGWRCPTFNMVFADDSGNIGYQTVGALPIRGREHRGFRFANDPRDAWLGTIPYDGLPRMHNPARGWVATANNPTAPADFPYPLNGLWSPEDRAPRAERLMEERKPHSLDGFAGIQTDIRSGRAERGTPGLRAAISGLTDEPTLRAAAHLRDWDFEMRTAAVAPALYYVFFWRGHQRVLGVRFPAELAPLSIDGGWGLSAALLHENVESWFASDDARREGIRTAFAEALAWLTERLGPEVDGWQWGKLHRLGAAHPAARTPLQHEVLDVPLQPHSGGAGTLANAFHTPFGTFETKMGANFRLIAAMNGAATTRSICWPGHSGQPGSAHY
ncbi:MAG: penicillin acylase family protein, partial [Thermomicrobiales bacterium]|nr:penicillin acylase family protein [Thermomicrobiales bacterium]